MSFSSRSCNEQYLCGLFFFPFVIIHKHLHSILINLITDDCGDDCDISYLRYSIIQQISLLLQNITMHYFIDEQQKSWYAFCFLEWKRNLKKFVWNYFKLEINRIRKKITSWWRLGQLSLELDNWSTSKTVHFWSVHCIVYFLCIECVYPACIL